MKNLLKIFFLFVIFALPVMIFLFLRYFGKNEFAIPVYYTAGLPADTLGCSYAQGPYHVYLPGLSSEEDNLIFLDADPGLINTSGLKNIITRIRSSADSVQMIVYSVRLASPLTRDPDLDYREIVRNDLPALKCSLVTAEESQFILIDRQGMIRGYYGTDRDEIDRLLVETDILTTHERTDR